MEFPINNTICRSTGNTPSKLLFGLAQLGVINDLVRLSLDQSIETRDLKEIREAASSEKNRPRTKKRMINLIKKRRCITSVITVMIVNIDTTARVNKKLIPKYKGPYVVHKILDADRYVVPMFLGSRSTQIPYQGIISADRMKPWIHD